MPNTYTQIHIQVVFAVKYRRAVIAPPWNKELYKYLTGIICNQGHIPLAINGMADHIHILFGMRPVQSLSELIQYIKASSSKWINENNKTEYRFKWQSGFGAFSYSKSQVPRVIKYIENQQNHHRKISFQKEYIEHLKKFEIEYSDEFLFNSPL